MNQQEQDQLKQLEESNQELKRQIELQAKQIEALKSSSAQSDEARFAPYSERGWAIVKEPSETHHEILPVWPSPRADYYAYPTKEQAEWEHKATQVRRKLQRICAVLGPATDDGGHLIEFAPGRHLNNIIFLRYNDARKAEQILGDDLKYLDWNNSPEAQDAREEKV